MSIVILYLGMVIAGYIFGSTLKKKNINLKWTGKVQLVAIVLLVFMMGARIGADKSVVESLGTIGLTAAILTCFAIVGSIFATFLARKAMKIDREGGRSDD